MKKLRILIADDHSLVRHGTRLLLQRRREWRVIGEAMNGREALAKAQKLKPDIAILDVAMPDLDGLEVTRQLRKEAPGTGLIILTMHESTALVRRALEAGAHGYVLKSDLADQLVKAVKNVSQGKLFLTPKVSEIVLSGFIEPDEQPSRAERPDKQPTPRELEIVRLLGEGRSNKEIATLLRITVRTVETHRAKLMLKFGVHSIAQLIHYAIRHEIIPPPTGAAGEL